jgi:acetaldehyde dehydrogenase (acetylating)
MDNDLQSIQEARRLADEAYAAWKTYETYSEDQVDRILRAIALAGVEHAERLARIAVEETGFGNVPDKTAKNIFGSRAVYEAMVPMRTIGIVRDDRANRILEVASPVGVIAGIVPSTNPTSTTLYKALIALKGRNAIVFSPHPSAVRAINETVRVIREAAEGAGAPPGVVASLMLPTMEATTELMRSPRTALILATGGPGLVRAAYSAGKPAFGVGPGNVPAYIERTADVPQAVADVLTGKCFDNGTLCSSEQAIVTDRVIAGQVRAELEARGAFLCKGEDKARLERTIRNSRGALNTAIVGKSAARIAEMAGIRIPSGTRALVGEAGGVGPDHPLSMEKLSPVLAFYTVEDWREGCQLSIEILKFGGLGHTLGLHSNDDNVIRQFALQKPASRICVNTPAALGAVGYTTNLFPSMTLGCGSFGGNITSDNISPLHLINLKRVAYGVRPAGGAGPDAASLDRVVPAPAVGAGQREHIRAIVDGWLQGRSPAGKRSAVPEAGARPVPTVAEAVPANPDRSVAAPPVGKPRRGPLERYDQIEVSSDRKPEAPGEPSPFVCEDDVRAADRRSGKITVNARTIITPSARELGDSLGVFLTVE